MKKTVLVVVAVMLIVALVGCDGSISGGEISPPDWIIGKWDLAVDDTLISTLTFTLDNVVFMVFSETDTGGIGVNFKDLASNKGISIRDSTPSFTEYFVELIDNTGGPNLKYIFTLADDGKTLDLSQNYGGIITPIEGFKKRD